MYDSYTTERGSDAGGDPAQLIQVPNFCLTLRHPGYILNLTHLGGPMKYPGLVRNISTIG